MTIIVTGGAGFIGSNFVQDWLDATDENLIVVDKLTYAGNIENLQPFEGNSRFQFVYGDILDAALFESLCSEHHPRAVVHFAAETHVDRSIASSDIFVQTNVVGTLRLLDVARQYAASGLAPEGFRFVHVSTDEVYGSLEPNAASFTETHPYAPNNPYSASKAASDHLARSYFHTYGLPVVITHCSNNYGPFQFPEKLIPLCLLNALSGKPLPLYGDGQQIRDWLYVQDHASALRCIVDNGRPGNVYNIGGNAEKTNLEVVRTLCLHLDRMQPRADGQSYTSQITFVTDRPGHDRRYAINSEKIATELGWRPQESFESGLERTIAWYLSHQDWIGSVTRGDYQAWVKQHYQQTP